VHGTSAGSLRPSPFLVHSEFSFVRKTASFKIFKTWTTHADCRPFLLNIWKKQVVGSGMHRLQIKLLRVKDVFRVWNKSVFSDVQRQVTLAKEEVECIQALIDVEGLDTSLYCFDCDATS